MKAPSPAFSFYPKDILSDEAAAAMTDEELGRAVREVAAAVASGDRSVVDTWPHLARNVRWPTTHRPHVPLDVRRAVFERDGYACCLCGATEGLSLDHIVAFADGGHDTPENLRVLCMDCNRRRGRG